MNNHSQETLRRVEDNDPTLTALRIGSSFIGPLDFIGIDGAFFSSIGEDFARLGDFIVENTHLTILDISLDNDIALDVENSAFYDGLKQNKSINKLEIWFPNIRNDVIIDGAGHEILKAYKANNNLTELKINHGVLQNGVGDHFIASTLRSCTNLRQIDLYRCSITDEQLQPMADSIREHRSLERLALNGNSFGSVGCRVLVTLLEDPNFNLRKLCLIDYNINNEGATALANSLAKNTKLRELNLNGNPINRSVVGIFSKLLCNMSSINSIDSSNHTLENLYPWQGLDLQLALLLKSNRKDINKSHVAIKKILLCHPIIFMEPFFEWNMEGEGERDLKALPYVIAWFDRAWEAVANNDEGGECCCNIEKRKLSAIFEFAEAMPLMFVPSSHVKGGVSKRKRDDYDRLADSATPHTELDSFY